MAESLRISDVHIRLGITTCFSRGNFRQGAKLTCFSPFFRRSSESNRNISGAVDWCSNSTPSCADSQKDGTANNIAQKDNVIPNRSSEPRVWGNVFRWSDKRKPYQHQIPLRCLYSRPCLRQRLPAALKPDVISTHNKPPILYKNPGEPTKDSCVVSCTRRNCPSRSLQTHISSKKTPPAPSHRTQENTVSPKAEDLILGTDRLARAGEKRDIPQRGALKYHEEKRKDDDDDDQD
jgi:hypothetical protein